MKTTIEIKFNTTLTSENIELIREKIEDSLGVEILEINNRGAELSDESNFYNDIKLNCETLIKIISGLEESDKGEINDLSIEFDTCKDDLIKSLEMGEEINEKETIKLLELDKIGEQPEHMVLIMLDLCLRRLNQLRKQRQ